MSLVGGTCIPTIRRLSFLVLLAATAITLAMMRVLQPTTLKADLLFSSWLLLPYALLAGIVAVGARHRTAALANLATTLLVAGGGLAYLADVVLFHPDAQGPIALLMIPALQVIASVIAAPLLRRAFPLLARQRAGRIGH